MPGKDMLLVEVDQLFLSNVGFVVLLKGSQDERSLPIFIGAAEAQSIAIFINQETRSLIRIKEASVSGMMIQWAKQIR